MTQRRLLAVFACYTCMRQTLNTMALINEALSLACHHHAMELPETLFISVPGSTIFFSFSHSLHFKKKFSFLKKKSEPTTWI